MEGVVVKSYRPQSYQRGAYTLILPEEMVPTYSSGRAILCDLQVAKDGNTTLLLLEQGNSWLLTAFGVSGIVDLLRGEGKFFLASSGGWSGGENLDGFIALKPGALVRYGAKGNWSYMVAQDGDIVVTRHDPRLFEEGSTRWKPLT